MFWCSGGYNEIDISQICTKLTTLALMLTLHSRVSVAYFIICTIMLVNVKLNAICRQVIIFLGEKLWHVKFEWHSRNEDGIRVFHSLYKVGRNGNFVFKGFKVHSHDAATATAFLPQWSQSVHTGVTMVAATVQ